MQERSQTGVWERAGKPTHSVIPACSWRESTLKIGILEWVPDRNTRGRQVLRQSPRERVSAISSPRSSLLQKSQTLVAYLKRENLRGRKTSPCPLHTLTLPSSHPHPALSLEGEGVTRASILSSGSSRFSGSQRVSYC